MSYYEEILNAASNKIEALSNQVVELIEIKRPSSIQYALHLTKIISKLSPLLGNLFEFRIVDELNENNEIYGMDGHWIRQDPGFPDAKFECDLDRTIGVEIKAWFPFATEITGRFKDSENTFVDNHINVAILAWLPEFVFWGKPILIKSLIVSGRSIAETRDAHYHNPPHYIILEPEDTSLRTGNLQQTNTNGYVFQDENTINKHLFEQAMTDVQSWGVGGTKYKTDTVYQQRLKTLFGKYPYRLDTNYAKIDRIQHQDIEHFKKNVLETIYKGKAIQEWKRIASLDNTNVELINAIKELMC